MTKFATFSCLMALLATNANAFAPSLPRRVSNMEWLNLFNSFLDESNTLFLLYASLYSQVASTTARHVLLTEEETTAIIEKAHDCAEGECSVDDVSGLITDLKDQQHQMMERMEEMMNMVAHLQKINSHEQRKKDDVKAYVRDLLRVFDTNSSGHPIGFSGDIGDGPKTAYDVLPPKKWTAEK